ncbi:hypothetical protein E2P84_42460 [Burkholderia cepacia]|uniref:hypothetical protein n=1 Tax=Burkholderia cepacia TaxID=292 RepID=UPI0010682FD4|nr:hypothetical protein [Burkholderia cepacia]TES62188.1 hypothetical protein E2P84_42460 [Burkholderia cepacia]
MKELNRQAVLGAFSDEAGRLPDGIDPETIDVVGKAEDCLRLLIATGISFSRPTDDEVAADGGTGREPVVEKVRGDDVLAAARIAAARVAASFVEHSR